MTWALELSGAVMRRFATRAAVLAVVGLLATCAAPTPARAVSAEGEVCSVGGLFSGVLGKLCSVATHAGRLLKATQQLLGGRVGGAWKALSGASTEVKALTIGAVLASIVAWVTGGAQYVLRETARVISATTRPQLQSTWFSSTYWRMAAISALLTLPFLFAAAIQAVIRSDLSLLARSAFGYLPLGMLAVSIAAPVTMLLLSASDELSGVISGASGDAGGKLLSHAGFVSGGVATVSGSSLLLLMFGLVTVMATLTLWMELLIRAAAVYVVVLMLPLFFAALVWPARKIWAVRAVELLVALILSKFVIVAVLSLGGAALGHTTLPGLTADLAGATLVLLAAFSPWALLALLPLHEVTGGLDGLGERTRGNLTPGPAHDDANAIAAALVRQLPAGSAPEYGPRDRGGAAGGEREAAAAQVGRLDESESAAAPEDAPESAGGAASAAAAASEPASAAAAASEPAAESPPHERLPGADKVWQADNNERATLNLFHEPSEPPPAEPPQ